MRFTDNIIQMAEDIRISGLLQVSACSEERYYSQNGGYDRLHLEAACNWVQVH